MSNIQVPAGMLNVTNLVPQASNSMVAVVQPPPVIYYSVPALNALVQQQMPGVVDESSLRAFNQNEAGPSHGDNWAPVVERRFSLSEIINENTSFTSLSSNGIISDTGNVIFPAQFIYDSRTNESLLASKEEALVELWTTGGDMHWFRETFIPSSKKRRTLEEISSKCTIKRVDIKICSTSTFYSYAPNTFLSALSKAINDILSHGIFIDWLLLKCEITGFEFSSLYREITIRSVESLQDLKSAVENNSGLPLPFVFHVHNKYMYFYFSFNYKNNPRLPKLNNCLFFRMRRCNLSASMDGSVDENCGIQINDSYVAKIGPHIFYTYGDNSDLFKQSENDVRRLIFHHMVWGFLQVWVRKIVKFSRCLVTSDEVASHLLVCFKEPSQVATLKDTAHRSQSLYLLGFTKTHVVYLKFNSFRLGEVSEHKLVINNIETDFVSVIPLIQYYRQFFYVNMPNQMKAVKDAIVSSIPEKSLLGSGSFSVTDCNNTSENPNELENVSFTNRNSENEVNRNVECETANNHDSSSEPQLQAITPVQSGNEKHILMADSSTGEIFNIQINKMNNINCDNTYEANPLGGVASETETETDKVHFTTSVVQQETLISDRTDNRTGIQKEGSSGLNMQIEKIIKVNSNNTIEGNLSECERIEENNILVPQEVSVVGVLTVTEGQILKGEMSDNRMKMQTEEMLGKNCIDNDENTQLENSITYRPLDFSKKQIGADKEINNRKSNSSENSVATKTREIVESCSNSNGKTYVINPQKLRNKFSNRIRRRVKKQVEHLTETDREMIENPSLIDNRATPKLQRKMERRGRPNKKIKNQKLKTSRIHTLKKGVEKIITTDSKSPNNETVKERATSSTSVTPRSNIGTAKNFKSDEIDSFFNQRTKGHIKTVDRTTSISRKRSTILKQAADSSVTISRQKKLEEFFFNEDVNIPTLQPKTTITGTSINQNTNGNFHATFENFLKKRGEEMAKNACTTSEYDCSTSEQIPGMTTGNVTEIRNNETDTSINASREKVKETNCENTDIPSLTENINTSKSLEKSCQRERPIKSVKIQPCDSSTDDTVEKEMEKMLETQHESIKKSSCPENRNTQKFIQRPLSTSRALESKGENVDSYNSDSSGKEMEYFIKTDGESTDEANLTDNINTPKSQLKVPQRRSVIRKLSQHRDVTIEREVDRININEQATVEDVTVSRLTTPDISSRTSTENRIEAINSFNSLGSKEIVGDDCENMDESSVTESINISESPGEFVKTNKITAFKNVPSNYSCHRSENIFQIDNNRPNLQNLAGNAHPTSGAKKRTNIVKETENEEGLSESDSENIVRPSSFYFKRVNRGLPYKKRKIDISFHNSENLLEDISGTQYKTSKNKEAYEIDDESNDELSASECAQTSETIRMYRGTKRMEIQLDDSSTDDIDSLSLQPEIVQAVDKTKSSELTLSEKIININNEAAHEEVRGNELNSSSRLPKIYDKNVIVTQKGKTNSSAHFKQQAVALTETDSEATEELSPIKSKHRRKLPKMPAQRPLKRERLSLTDSSTSNTEMEVEGNLNDKFVSHNSQNENPTTSVSNAKTPESTSSKDLLSTENNNQSESMPSTSGLNSNSSVEIYTVEETEQETIEWKPETLLERICAEEIEVIFGLMKRDLDSEDLIADVRNILEVCYSESLMAMTRKDMPDELILKEYRFKEIIQFADTSKEFKLFLKQIFVVLQLDYTADTCVRLMNGLVLKPLKKTYVPNWRKKIIKVIKPKSDANKIDLNRSFTSLPSEIAKNNIYKIKPCYVKLNRMEVVNYFKKKSEYSNEIFFENIASKPAERSNSYSSELRRRRLTSREGFSFQWRAFGFKDPMVSGEALQRALARKNFSIKSFVSLTRLEDLVEFGDMGNDGNDFGLVRVKQEYDPETEEGNMIKDPRRRGLFIRKENLANIGDPEGAFSSDSESELVWLEPETVPLLWDWKNKRRKNQ